MSSYFAIDFGTSKFCAARLLMSDDEKIERVDVLSVRSAGMRRGEPVDVAAVKDGLDKLLEHAETQWGVDIQRVALTLPSNFVQLKRSTSDLALKGKPVRDEHCAKLAELALDSADDHKLFLLRTLAESYHVDDREDVRSPVGFTGEKLSGSFLHLFSVRHVAHDLIKICNDSGIQVVELVPQGLSSALGSGLVENGVDDFALIDIGGGACQGAVFQQGKLKQLVKVPVGGHHFTNDLISGLGIIKNDAERLKEIYGMSRSQEAMSCSTIDGSERSISGEDALRILGPRLSELGELLSNALRPSETTQKINCVYVTGGTSNMRNLPKALSHLMGKPVLRVAPIVFSQHLAKIQNTESKFSSSEIHTNSAVLGALFVYAFGFPGEVNKKFDDYGKTGFWGRVQRVFRFFL